MQQTEKKLRHPPYYYAVISRLTRYKPNQDRIAYLLRELSMMGVKTTQVCSDMPHGSGTSDSTGDLASRIGDRKRELLQLQNEVELIDLAVGMLSEQKQLIIKVRYLTEYGQDKNARITLRASARKYKWRTMHHGTYERLRDEAIMEVARMFGEQIEQ